MGTEENLGFKLEIDIDAATVLDDWGGGLKNGILDYGNPNEILELNSGNNTKNISVFLGGKDDQGNQMLMLRGENNDGSKFSAKIVKGQVFDIRRY